MLSTFLKIVNLKWSSPGQDTDRKFFPMINCKQERPKNTLKSGSLDFAV
jgi:hypothetical protein